MILHKRSYRVCYAGNESLYRTFSNKGGLINNFVYTRRLSDLRFLTHLVCLFINPLPSPTPAKCYNNKVHQS